MTVGKNVVLVIFDSLREDCIGAYGSPPWGEVKTPNLDSLASESLLFTRVYPESLPTLPARRAIYTGRNVYPFHNSDFRLKGDFVGAPGWGPIPEDQDTVAELLRESGYRTGLLSTVYHMFKPSKNFHRGFDQWMFIRGKEEDPQRSGPDIPDEELYRWVPKEFLDEPRTPTRSAPVSKLDYMKRCLKNMHDRQREEDYHCARLFTEAARWLEQNRDAERFFLCVESFDPHEPLFVPEHYRRMYDDSDGQENVLSGYGDTASVPPELLYRTQANYSGLVTMCDRWFGHLYETMRVLGMLEDTLLIVTTDHGHSIGDEGYMGKRGYPSEPSFLDIPLMVRHPGGAGAGTTSDLLVQHTDIAPAILAFAGVEPREPLDGRPFLDAALEGREGLALRDHLTVAWCGAVTVIDDRWWLNIKVDGAGALLYDLEAPEPRARNVADDHPDVVRRLFGAAMRDARGGLPDYIKELAQSHEDAPGCSSLTARPL